MESISGVWKRRPAPGTRRNGKPAWKRPSLQADRHLLRQPRGRGQRSGPGAHRECLSVRRAPCAPRKRTGEESVQKRKLGGRASRFRGARIRCGRGRRTLHQRCAQDQERAVGAGHRAGINYFDTAAKYGDGESEKNLGRGAEVAEGRRRGRHQIPPRRGGSRRRRPGSSSVDRGSLKRLGRDHVDLLQLHNPLVAAMRATSSMSRSRSTRWCRRWRSCGSRARRASSASAASASPRAAEGRRFALFDTVQVVYNALNPSAAGPMPTGAPAST